MADITKKPKDFVLKDNTLAKVVKNNPADKIEVEIGDAKQLDFKPQFKVSRWDNEVNFSMRAEEDPKATVEVDGEVVKYKAKDYEVHQYEKPDVSEDGGFEFEWVLPKKPKKNILRATIETKELDFFYQPELTQGEIDEGAQRPENVVGSYAVYHKTKKNNIVGGKEYKTGKFCHIYRPKAIDANGVEQWCDLNIDEKKKELTVTVPQDFLDSATYPVVVDPTFGYTSVGATIISSSADTIRAIAQTAPENGTLTSVTFYNGNNVNDDGPSKVGVYLRDGNSADSHTLIGSSSEISPHTNSAWLTGSVSGTITSGSEYFLAVYSSESAIAKDTVTVDAITALQSYTGTWPNPYNQASNDSNDYYSIYATYTATGGGGGRRRIIIT